MSFRRWLAGKLSALGGSLVRLADRIYPPPVYRQYYIDHARRESRGWD